MARFKFGLARLMRVREIREEIARTELIAAEAAAREAEHKLDQARARKVDAELELGAVQAHSALTPAQVLVAQGVLPDLERRIAAHRVQTARLKQTADGARRVWMDSRVDVRALEKLEERARGVFQGDERAREDKVLQEIVDRRTALASFERTNETSSS